MDLVNLVSSLWKKNDPVVPAPVVVHRPPTALELRQQLLAHHVRLVARGMSNGLAVYGSRGGLGKTKVVLETLKEEGKNPVVLNGHITPLSLYANLYERPDAVLFLDDCDSLFRNLPALGILRSALWGDTNEKRLVTGAVTVNHNAPPVLKHNNPNPRANHAPSAVARHNAPKLHDPAAVAKNHAHVSGAKNANHSQPHAVAHNNPKAAAHPKAHAQAHAAPRPHQQHVAHAQPHAQHAAHPQPQHVAQAHSSSGHGHHK